MRPHPFLAVLALGAALSACAHAPEAVEGPPNYAPLATQTAGPLARLYADCIRQAAETGAFGQVIDGGEELLLFTCSGRVAAVFYAALGPHSERMDSAFAQGGRSYRSTAKVQRDLIGVDHCSVAADGREPRCTLTFNAGDFLVAAD
ncbi:MAG: hypothetical protein ACK4VY_02590 [Brevundimonas sp.]